MEKKKSRCSHKENKRKCERGSQAFHIYAMVCVSIPLFCYAISPSFLHFLFLSVFLFLSLSTEPEQHVSLGGSTPSLMTWFTSVTACCRVAQPTRMRRTLAHRCLYLLLFFFHNSLCVGRHGHPASVSLVARPCVRRHIRCRGGSPGTPQPMTD